MSAKPPSHPDLVWVDIETTGLDPAHGRPLEIAVYFTDKNLNLKWGLTGVIHWSEAELASIPINDYVREMHTANGLWNEVAESKESILSVDQEIARALAVYGNGPKPPLAGSTISFDRAWLSEWFPLTVSRLHYRNVDVSTLKELALRWRPDAVLETDDEAHRAQPDVEASILALKHYRAAFLAS